MSYLNLPQIDLVIALGVFVSTAVTDAAYVFFNAAVGARKRVAVDVDAQAGSLSAAKRKRAARLPACSPFLCHPCYLRTGVGGAWALP